MTMFKDRSHFHICDGIKHSGLGPWFDSPYMYVLVHSPHRNKLHDAGTLDCSFEYLLVHDD